MSRLSITNIIIGLASIIGLAAGFHFYWEYQERYPSTEDAYLQAHIVPISTQVSGKVQNIYVHENQEVEKGDALFDLDPKPFELAVEKARANLQLAQQQVAAQGESLKIAQANISKSQAQLTVAEKNYRRINSLVEQGRAPKAEDDEANMKLLESQANLQAAKDEEKRLQKLLGDQEQVNAQINLAKVQLQQAELNLEYSKVHAPSAGKISQLSLRQGTVVGQGQGLFSIVEQGSWWIKANFKETSIKEIKPKQKVSVKFDMYPGVSFIGVVESIGAGSDVSFSLFPPENASGNWVKITQRIPVRIKIVDPNTSYPLRIGASSQVVIDTQSLKS